jgi:hypothetical protein
MKHAVLISILAGFVATAIAAVQTQSAAAKPKERSAPVVFVQTNEAAGNKIVVYDRASNGRLSRAGTYATGGNGGVATPGTESDHLASQGSLVYDSAHRLLIAVNAGSDSVSTFGVHGDELHLESVVSSGGQFPASIGVHGSLVYVLNSGGAGVVQGFRIAGDALVAIPGSARSLGLANTDPPFFLSSPGQVGFTPDGQHLLVTTKASGNLIDSFQVGPNGRLSATPVANPSATPVPFAFTFDSSRRLVDGEAGISALTTYVVGQDGTLSGPHSLSDNQVALCWVTRVGDFYYVSNTGSNTISGYRIGADGQPALIGAGGIAATTDAGPIDSTAPASFLYVEAGVAGAVDEFSVGADGSLTSIGSVTGLPVGLEGIASTG